MLLDATNKSIEILLGGVVTTSELQCIADWVDLTYSSTSDAIPGVLGLNTNGVLPVTIVPHPAVNTQRKVNRVTVYNSDTISQTVTVRYNVGGVLFREVSTVVAPRQTLQFTDTSGWSLFPSPGGLPMVVATVPALPRSTNIVAVTLPGTSPPGVYRISYSLECIAQDAAAGNITFSGTYDSGAGSFSLPALPLTVAPVSIQGSAFIQIASLSGSVQYSVVNSGIYGAAQYTLLIVVERMQ